MSVVAVSDETFSGIRNCIVLYALKDSGAMAYMMSLYKS
jgi:hypothetical protein